MSNAGLVHSTTDDTAVNAPRAPGVFVTSPTNTISRAEAPAAASRRLDVIDRPHVIIPAKTMPGVTRFHIADSGSFCGNFVDEGPRKRPPWIWSNNKSVQRLANGSLVTCSVRSFRTVRGHRLWLAERSITRDEFKAREVLTLNPHPLLISQAWVARLLAERMHSGTNKSSELIWMEIARLKEKLPCHHF